jgi:hypothetical protein
MVRYMAQGALQAVSASSFGNSSDSYNKDNAHHYLHGQNEALGRCREAAQETERLEAALIASQTAVATVEGESSVARAWLAESNARVTCKIFRRDPILLVLCSIMPFLMIPSFSYHSLDGGIGGSLVCGE